MRNINFKNHSNIDLNDNMDNIIIHEIRLMIEDICPYSCEWCAVNGYKKEISTGKKIELSDYGHNEGALVQNKKDVEKDYLTVEDYNFLAGVFKNYFGTKEVSLTGGEALKSKNYEQISDRLKNNQGLKTTVLTKGAGLFGKEDIEKLKNTDRLIFSLDTLDNKEHALLNLPLKKGEHAEKFLPKTINSIKKSILEGKEITINTVITPDDDDNKFYDLIKFCIDNDIEDIKFLELDSKEIKEPYIEKKFKNFFNKGKLKDFNFRYKKNVQSDIEKRQIVGNVLTKSGKTLKVSVYRLICAQEHIFNLEEQKNNSNHIKTCEIGKSNSITINTTGDFIPCLGTPNKKIPLSEFIKSRDINGLVLQIKRAVKIIKEQKCPIN